MKSGTVSVLVDFFLGLVVVISLAGMTGIALQGIYDDQEKDGTSVPQGVKQSAPSSPGGRNLLAQSE